MGRRPEQPRCPLCQRPELRKQQVCPVSVPGKCPLFPAPGDTQAKAKGEQGQINRSGEEDLPPGRPDPSHRHSIIEQRETGGGQGTNSVSVRGADSRL